MQNLFFFIITLYTVFFFSIPSTSSSSSSSSWAPFLYPSSLSRPNGVVCTLSSYALVHWRSKSIRAVASVAIFFYKHTTLYNIQRAVRSHNMLMSMRSITLTWRRWWYHQTSRTDSLDAVRYKYPFVSFFFILNKRTLPRYCIGDDREIIDTVEIDQLNLDGGRFWRGDENVV